MNNTHLLFDIGPLGYFVYLDHSFLFAILSVLCIYFRMEHWLKRLEEDSCPKVKGTFSMFHSSVTWSLHHHVRLRMPSCCNLPLCYGRHLKWTRSADAQNPRNCPHNACYTTPSRGPKLIRPVIKLNCTNEEWNAFCRRWETYKTGSNISDERASGQLLECTSSELGDIVLRA